MEKIRGGPSAQLQPLRNPIAQLQVEQVATHGNVVCDASNGRPVGAFRLVYVYHTDKQCGNTIPKLLGRGRNQTSRAYGHHEKTSSE